MTRTPPTIEHLPGPGDAGAPRRNTGVCALKRPRFFFGQLLDHEDLTALVDWAQDKLALARHRDGWGVACGLGVDADPLRPGAALLRAGYAVDPRGRHVLVPRTTPVDLAPACAGDSAAMAWPGRAAPATLSFAGVNFPTRRLWVVDLELRYREVAGELHAPFRQGSCGETAHLEASRVEEGFEVRVHRASPTISSLQAQAREWKDAFSATAAVLEAFLDAFPDLRQTGWTATYSTPADRRHLGGKVRRWLLETWLAERPLNRLRWLDDWLRHPDGGLDDKTLGQEEELTRVLLWLVQDARLSFLNSPCPSPRDPEAGVPLARVWLTASPPPAGYPGPPSQCRVVHVEAHPPHRRLLTPDTWPAPPGRINLARVLWCHPEEACRVLAREGIRGAQVETVDPTTLAELRRLVLECELFAGCPAPDLVLQVLDAQDLGVRVVGLTSRRTGPPTVDEPEPPVKTTGLVLEKSPVVAEAFPWHKIDFTFTVTNAGEKTLQVNVEDDLAGRLTRKRGRELLPGARLELASEVEIPGDAPRHLDATTRATGTDATDADGEVVNAEATTTITVMEPHDFALIGMLQKWGSGVLKDPRPAYQAQIFTLQQFGRIDPRHLMAAYSRALSNLPDDGRALAKRWQELALELVEAGLYTAADAAVLSHEELAAKFPRLTRKRIRRLSRLAKRRAERRDVDWKPLGDEREDDEEADEKGAAKDVEGPAPRGPAAGRKASRRKATEPKEPAPTPKPTPEDESEPDDLSQLPGLGRKRIRRLSEAGLVTFEDVARATVAELKEILPGMRNARLQEVLDEAARRVGERT